MGILAILLTILGIIKIILVYGIDKVDYNNFYMSFLPVNPGQIKQGIIGYFVFEGLVEILCGIYIILLW